jgi:hypothetical protein
MPSSFAISRCVRSSPPSSNPNRPTTMHLIHDIVRFRPEDVDQRNFIPLFVRSDGIMQGHIFACFLQRPQMHQDLVFNTASRECRKLRPFVWRERLNRFDLEVVNTKQRNSSFRFQLTLQDINKEAA